MLADGINISNKTLIACIFGRQNAGEQMNKTCTLVFQSALAAKLTKHRISAQQKADKRCLPL